MKRANLEEELSDAIWSVIKKHGADASGFTWDVEYTTESGQTVKVGQG